jgi:heat shock protein HslJ
MRKMDPYQQVVMIGIFVAVAVAVAGCATSGDRYGPSGPAPELAGTRWVVTSIDGAAPLNDTVVRADFGVDGRVNGYSGCNSFSGPYIQTGNAVQIGELLSTRRACLDGSAQRQEDRVLHILQGPNTARLDRGRLSLRSNDGRLVLSPGTAIAETTYNSPR